LSTLFVKTTTKAKHAIEQRLLFIYDEMNVSKSDKREEEFSVKKSLDNNGSELSKNES
jgi:hypothetical protein